MMFIFEIIVVTLLVVVTSEVFFIINMLLDNDKDKKEKEVAEKNLDTALKEIDELKEENETLKKMFILAVQDFLGYEINSEDLIDKHFSQYRTRVNQKKEK